MDRACGTYGTEVKARIWVGKHEGKKTVKIQALKGG